MNKEGFSPATAVAGRSPLFVKFLKNIYYILFFKIAIENLKNRIDLTGISLMILKVLYPNNILNHLFKGCGYM